MSISQNIRILKDKYNNKSPIALGFRTLDKQYIYDTGTGKVVACKDLEYRILENIIRNKLEEIHELGETYGVGAVSEAFDVVMEYIQKEHILEVVEFKSILTDSDYKEKLTSKQEQLMLELTEQCNLRCKYCVYHEEHEGHRGFGTRSMTQNIAFKAIDRFKQHSIEAEEVSVTFYGGEPLLEFNLMRECIEYASYVLKHKSVQFGFTTNLTLITPEMAKYLSQVEDIVITVSLDGPENIHDSYRVDASGKGTFSRSIRGLKYLVEAFGERAKRCLNVNMVYSPPYNKEKLDEIEKFYTELDWLPEEVSKSITYVEDNTLPQEIMEEAAKAEEYTLFDRAKDKVGTSDYTNSLITQVYKMIYNSPMFEEPVDSITLNACCVPGHRRIYVTVEGDYKMCERVGEVPYIGNVEEDINIDFIKKEYLDDYAEKSYKDCSTCWAARLCNVCYAHSYEKDKMSIDKKRVQCEGTRVLMAQSFSQYYELLDKDPEKLKYLEDIIFV